MKRKHLNKIAIAGFHGAKAGAIFAQMINSSTKNTPVDGVLTNINDQSMIIGFKDQFVPSIITGTKIHTIRTHAYLSRKGSLLKLIRANAFVDEDPPVFKEVTCTSVQRIFMSYDGVLHVSIHGRELYPYEKEILAKNDGFDSLADFEDWFIPQFRKREFQSYIGYIIHWTDLRYGE